MKSEDEEKKEDIIIGEYKFVSDKVKIILEIDTVEGFKTLNQYNLDQILEVKYYNSKFHLVYDSSVAARFLNASWVSDNFEVKIKNSKLWIKLMEVGRIGDYYLRSLLILNPVFILEEIREDGKIIIGIKQ